MLEIVKRIATLQWIYIIILAMIGIADWRTRKIQNESLFLLLLYSVPQIYLYSDISVGYRIVGLFIISIPLLLLTMFLPGSFGGGDIKFMAVNGWILGCVNIVIAFSVGMMFGGMVILPLLLLGRVTRKDEVAMGPFLVMGCIVAVLFGDSIALWYIGSFCK